MTEQQTDEQTDQQSQTSRPRPSLPRRDRSRATTRGSTRPRRTAA